MVKKLVTVREKLASTSAEAVSGFEDVRYFCFYKINNFNL
jgi:hypothetical protein